MSVYVQSKCLVFLVKCLFCSSSSANLLLGKLHLLYSIEYACEGMEYVLWEYARNIELLEYGSLSVHWRVW